MIGKKNLGFIILFFWVISVKGQSKFDDSLGWYAITHNINREIFSSIDSHFKSKDNFILQSLFFVYIDTTREGLTDTIISSNNRYPLLNEIVKGSIVSVINKQRNDIRFLSAVNRKILIIPLIVSYQGNSNQSENERFFIDESLNIPNYNDQIFPTEAKKYSYGSMPMSVLYFNPVFYSTPHYSKSRFVKIVKKKN